MTELTARERRILDLLVGEPPYDVPAVVDGHKVHQRDLFGGYDRPHGDDDDCPLLTCLEWAKVKRFHKHLDDHGCTERGTPPGNPGGFAYCPEAMELFRAMPPSQTVVVG